MNWTDDDFGNQEAFSSPSWVCCVVIFGAGAAMVFAVLVGYLLFR